MPAATHANGHRTEPIEATVALQPAPAQPEQPGRILGLQGAPVTLAQTVYHWARFTAAGFRELHTFIQDAETQLVVLPAGEQATLGEMVAEALSNNGQVPVGGALVNVGELAEQRWQAFLERTLAEAVPPDLAGQCEPREVVAAVDDFFDQSGLRLLERLLKNSLNEQLNARLRQQLVDLGRQQETAIPTTSAPPLT